MTKAAPTDGQHVWIRFASRPALATWNATTEIFTLDDPAINIPWWFVEVWAPGP